MAVPMITATSVNMERVFSCTHRLIMWERNQLSAQSIRALMCLGAWSILGYVSNDVLLDITKDGAVRVAKEDMDKEDIDFEPGFNTIVLTDSNNE